MYPELFKLPFINRPVPSYGLMMVFGFLSAIYIIRYLSRDITPDPLLITNAALYSLIAGVVGARLFYVIHHFSEFQGRLLSIFAIWKGGLELLGGVLSAIAVIFLYLWRQKLPIRRYLDILAIGLMLALFFGRIGCFLNGCCFGKPTNLPWAVRFPYHHPLLIHSPVYKSQVYANPERNRSEAQLKLPVEFFGYFDENNVWNYNLKPWQHLTDEQKEMVENGELRSLPVHPTQLYSSASGAILCIILYLLWERAQKAGYTENTTEPFAKPGCIFSLMFIFYGITRFLLEFLRDDNPFELDSLTISQLISIALIALGAVLMVIFEKMKPKIAR
ncbi:MAG: prolipoprotein diacylglyceryl transferase [Planctomycetota bacterium]|jgi:phosphatidylglycerol:prolipoprotein diacylglycerol transferase